MNSLCESCAGSQVSFRYALLTGDASIIVVAA
jgi:hypothetical protein